jgi:hypothetical protein
MTSAGHAVYRRRVNMDPDGVHWLYDYVETAPARGV